MKQKSKPAKVEYESVKIEKEIVNEVRVSKKTTGTPIAIFFKQAAREKLDVLKSNKGGEK